MLADGAEQRLLEVASLDILLALLKISAFKVKRVFRGLKVSKHESWRVSGSVLLGVL